MIDDYPVVITKIPKEEGGGFNACIPAFGEYAMQGDGETVQEAYDNLMECAAELEKDTPEEYAAYMKIPPPERPFCHASGETQAVWAGATTVIEARL